MWLLEATALSFKQALRRLEAASHPALWYFLTVLKTRTRLGGEASMMEAFQACTNTDKKKVSCGHCIYPQPPCPNSSSLGTLYPLPFPSSPSPYN